MGRKCPRCWSRDTGCNTIDWMYICYACFFEWDKYDESDLFRNPVILISEHPESYSWKDKKLTGVN